MRQLTTKQKTLIDEAYTASGNKISSADELSQKLWEELERLNDTEILYQEVNRYLGDKFFESGRV